ALKPVSLDGRPVLSRSRKSIYFSDFTRTSITPDEVDLLRSLMESYPEAPSLGILNFPILFSRMHRCGFSKGQFWFITEERSVLDSFTTLKVPFYYTQLVDGKFIAYFRPDHFLSGLLRSCCVNPYAYESTAVKASRQDTPANIEDSQR
ncbi:hypothetical protein, partial [Glycocaulis alkaliphilus]|uniref:hypothetical protein n=1 Tax=Glycocaulis alkaliphilus TaxID=1434191 RepID=UPI001F2B9C0F